MPNEDDDQHALLGAQADTGSSSSSSSSDSGAVRKYDDKDGELDSRQASLDSHRNGDDDNNDDDNEERRLLGDSDTTEQHQHQEHNEDDRRDSYEMEIQEPASSDSESTFTKTRGMWRCPLVAAFVVLFFLLFKVAMLVAFQRDENQRQPDAVFYNGTEYFDPTVILISLDGFRNDYLLRNQTPNLVQLGFRGVRADYMHPSFPSITAPNHWTMVTGLHPESHGIVANEFYDPDLKKEFIFTEAESSHDPRWWKGEPIWNTLKRQEKRSAVIMWPGSTVEGLKPDIVIPFNATTSPQEKIDQVLQWMDLPRDQRPHFIGVYMHQVDQQGHSTGPHSEQLDNVLKEIDNAIGQLVDGLEKRNIIESIHTVVVSDHGMAETDRSRVIYYDDILSDTSLSWLREREAGPLLGLRPKDGEPKEAIHRIYQELYNYTQHTSDPHFQVYLRQNVPNRFHYQNNTRISPIVAIPDVGYVFTNHDEWHPQTSTEPFAPRGIHGYDNFAQEMRAIFMASGPKIDLMYGRYSVVAPFFNTEVYSFICNLLNVSPAPHNGTLDGHFYRIA